MGLLDFFRPKWRHRHWAVRTIAVRDMKSPSQSHLLRIAVNDEDYHVRDAALRRLAELWINSKAGFAKTIEQFHDYDILMRIAMNDNIQDFKLRAAAVEKLNNQDMLFEVAKSQCCFENCRADSFDIFSENEIDNIRTIANNIRIIATIKITDQIILTEIAKGIHRWPTGRVRLAAAKSIADPRIAQSILGEIAKNGNGNSGDWDLRKAAADMLTDRILAASLYAKISFDTAAAVERRQAKREAEQKATLRNLQLAQQENCHHDYVMDPEVFCDYCRQFEHTGKCRICGHRRHHICT